MPSKQVTDRQKSATSVVAAGETHADLVAVNLQTLLSPYLRDGEVVPDFRVLTRLISRALADANSAMVLADEAHHTELADDAAPRGARDQVAAALYNELTELREWLTGVFGAGVDRRFGFSDLTPRDPVPLERFAGEVTTALATQPLPAPRRTGVTWSPSESIHTLEALRAELRGHLKDVAREVREAHATLIAKNTAMATYDERFICVATALNGLFRLAGHTDLAARVRPSTRRAGQTESDTEAEDGGISLSTGGGLVLTDG